MVQKQSESYTPGVSVNYTWSAKFNLRGRLPVDTVINRLGTLLVAYADGTTPLAQPEECLALSGALVGRGNGPKDTLVLGVDPSRTFGAAKKVFLEQAATDLARTQKWGIQTVRLPELRVIMGRVPGYEGDKPFSMRQTEEFADNGLGLDECELFSVRHIRGQGIRSYHEPGVIVSAPRRSFEAVERLGHQLHQLRFVAEFTNQKTQVYEK